MLLKHPIFAIFQVPFPNVTQIKRDFLKGLFILNLHNRHLKILLH